MQILLKCPKESKDKESKNKKVNHNDKVLTIHLSEYLQKTQFLFCSGSAIPCISISVLNA